MSVNKNVLKGIHWEFTGTGTINKSLMSREKKRNLCEYVSPYPFFVTPPPPSEHNQKGPFHYKYTLRME